MAVDESPGREFDGLSWRITEPCARACGRTAAWFHRDEWVCDPCYAAEEFAPGHWLTGSAMHFRGRCNDCDIRYAAGMSLEGVQRLYHEGVFSQDVFEAYCHVWHTAAYRYSSGGWGLSPAIPEVVRLVAVMRGQLALRVTAETAMRGIPA
jgi:hypothetical protein